MQSKTLMEKVEVIVNTFNHALIGFLAIYMTWYCFKGAITSKPLHAWLCTIGYQLLLAEGVMCFYSANAWTSQLAVKTKRTVHWILQVLGSALGLAGVIVMIVHEKGKHFTSIHGILGLTSTVLLGVNLVTGLCALFSFRLRKLLQPFLTKTIHNFFGLSAFVLGIVTLYYGFVKLHRDLDNNFIKLLQVCSLITVVLCLIGSLKSFYKNIRSLLDNESL